jgi:hypothetical protein
MANKTPLRAVTIWQPFASLLAVGVKPVENRTWSPRAAELRVGQCVAIHAGAKYDRESWEYVVSLSKRLKHAGRWTPQREAPWRINAAKPSRDADSSDVTPYSAIIGVAVLDEVRTEPRVFCDDAGDYEDPWWCGPVGWYLRDPVPFAPVLCSGARGLWTVEGETLDVVRERYRAAR